MVNTSVQFTGSAENGVPPYQFHWMFGDGATAEEQNSSHTYAARGNYSVTLKVTDETGVTAFDDTWAMITGNDTPPATPVIDGPTKAKVGTPVNYTVTTTDPEEDAVFYFVDWGDNTSSGWLGPYPSGVGENLSHTWAQRGSYIIRCKARDNAGMESGWGVLHVRMPLMLSLPVHPLVSWLLERFPHLFPVLRFLYRGVQVG